MLSRWRLFILLPFLLGATAGAEQSLGVQDGFYRQAQILASWMGAGQSLEVIPDYYNELGDFPYMRKDTAREIPFADCITVSRFLGGFAPGYGGTRDVAEAKALDLVHRKEDGSLEYCWGGQMDHLQKYLDAGISEVVLSIDNIPYDLAKNPHIAEFGQSNPPEDIKEWQRFFEAFLDEMEVRYGVQFMNSISFRVGTEANGTLTYTGDIETYIDWYCHAAESLKKKFPGAKIGLCEVAGGVSKNDNIYFVEVARRLFENGVSVDFIANSSHAYPVWAKNGRLGGAADPRERAAVNESVYRKLIGDRDIPAYVFQFGVLRSEVQDAAGAYLGSDEPGPRGAAWTLIALMETRRLWPSIKGIGHWDVTAAVPGKPQMRLLKGNGWVYTVLDHLRGREMFALDAGEESPNGSFCKAYAFVDPESDKQYVMAAAFNVDRTVSDRLPVEIQLPVIMRGKSWAVRSCALTVDNSPFYALRSDLLNAGLLPAAYAAHDRLVAEPRFYAGKDRALRQNMDAVFETEFLRYVGQLKDSLRLVKSSEACSGRLVWQMSVPSVVVFELMLEK
jgi:hypothetical protein